MLLALIVEKTVYSVAECDFGCDVNFWILKYLKKHRRRCYTRQRPPLPRHHSACRFSMPHRSANGRRRPAAHYHVIPLRVRPREKHCRRPRLRHDRLLFSCRACRRTSSHQGKEGDIEETCKPSVARGVSLPFLRGVRTSCYVLFSYKYFRKRKLKICNCEDATIIFVHGGQRSSRRAVACELTNIPL